MFVKFILQITMTILVVVALTLATFLISTIVGFGFSAGCTLQEKIQNEVTKLHDER